MVGKKKREDIIGPEATVTVVQHTAGTRRAISPGLCVTQLESALSICDRSSVDKLCLNPFLNADIII
jgi:hypothetical protein